MCDCNKTPSKTLSEQLYEALRPDQAFRAGIKMTFPQGEDVKQKPAPAAKTHERIAMETELRVEALRAAVTADYDDKTADEIIQDARIFYAFLITSLI